MKEDSQHGQMLRLPKAGFLATRNMTRIIAGLALSYVKLKITVLMENIYNVQFVGMV